MNLRFNFALRTLIGRQRGNVFIRIRNKHTKTTIHGFPAPTRFLNSRNSSLVDCAFPYRPLHTSVKRCGTEFLLDRETAQRHEDEARDFPYAIHTAEFTTCDEYYGFLVASGQNRPITGITFNVAYIDTHPDASPRKPTVVALHGCPGNHLDFKELAKFLDGKGVRFIAPNFPGYGWTPIDKRKVFTHNQAEKAMFVKDFLSVINVPKVDLMLVHSAGTYPALLLCSAFPFVKSLIMMNPGSLQRIESLRIKWLVKLLCKGYRNALFRFLSLMLMKVSLVAVGYGNTNAHHMSVAMETLVNINFDMSRQNATKLAIQKFKTGLIYSKNDRVVTLPQFEDYVQVFGSDVDGVRTYDVDGKIKTDGTNIETNFETHCFESGGHFVMKKFPTTVNNIVYDFLKKSKPELK